ncbi:MAG: histidine phosphatase family protein [Dermatophilaceae bacterium]
MSLHCPATLYVTRHGEAAFDGEDGTWTDAGGRLTEVGRGQVVALAARLAHSRIAGVRTSGLQRAVESGEVAAAALGVGTAIVAGLEEWRVGEFAGRPSDDREPQAVFEAWLAGDLDARIPGAETGREVVARYRSALEEIADLHRGENVLIFSHGGVMALVLPRIADNLADDQGRLQVLPNAVPAILEAGDDGWFMRSWPGREGHVAT